MKKTIFFLVFVLAVQMNYKIAHILAQDDKDVLAIKSSIETFLKNLAYGDIDSTMQSVSTNYSNRERDIDYDEFKSRLKDNVVARSKEYTDYSNYNLDIVKSDIKDNSAIVEIEFSWKGLNLHTNKEESGIRKRRVYLAKEHGTWKITQWQWLRRK